MTSLQPLFSNEKGRTLTRADLNLTQRTSIALDLALEKFDGEKIWLIYAIDYQPASTHDSSSTSETADRFTLNDIVFQPAFLQNDRSKKIPQSNLVVSLSGQNLNPTRPSQSAVILDYSLESGNPCLYQVRLQKMGQSFFSDDRPIFWLGSERSIESIEWLATQFAKTNYLKLKQQIIGTIGAHYCSKEVIDFLKQIVLNSHCLAFKEEAITWLGRHHASESIQFLAFLAIKQNDIQLRKKAIFALSQIPDRKARAIVSTLARKERNREVRQEAIFWLSQIADDEVFKTLDEILANDPNSRIKNYAVFAISQLPADKAIPRLHHIAQSNPDAQVRQRAKFWLDRSHSQRMMDFFKELVEEDNRDGSN